jgi:mannose-6-phosphate isomerase-like protein (cupin superfamily)
MHNSHLAKALMVLLLGVAGLSAADPTFMVRKVPSIQPQPDDLTLNAKGAAYKPIFGAGDKDARQLQSVARYGEITISPDGATAEVNYPEEEQVYFVLEGSGTLRYSDQKVPLRSNDVVFFPPSVKHGVANNSTGPLRVVVMGFRIPKGTPPSPIKELRMANAEDVPFQEMPGHGKTSLFRMLLGPHDTPGPGKIPNRLQVAQVVEGMYIIEFAPTGTNIPHHHPMEEEIYYLIRGHGDMVAGGGIDGNEGRYHAVAGDVYFFRLNTTVGFYGGNKEGEPNSAVLAIRSRYPFRGRTAADH